MAFPEQTLQPGPPCPPHPADAIPPCRRPSTPPAPERPGAGRDPCSGHPQQTAEPRHRETLGTTNRAFSSVCFRNGALLTREVSCLSQFTPTSQTHQPPVHPPARVRGRVDAAVKADLHVSESFSCGNASGLAPANTVSSENWSTLANPSPPLKMRSTSSFLTLDFEGFFFPPLLPLVVRIHPLVNVRTAGVGFRLGPAEFWFSVVHLHGSTHSLPPAGAAVAALLKVGPAPHPQHVGERDLAFPPRPRGYRTHVDTSSVPAPSLRAGAGGHLAKHLHFPQYQRDITQVHRRRWPPPSRSRSLR